MNIVNEIENDYLQFCKKKLISLFPDYIPKLEDSPMYDIERYSFRRIHRKKRKLFISKSLNNIPFRLKDAFNKICNDILKGNDLLRYQSRFLKDYDFNDKMLADWGVHHLHLSTKVEHDGYVKRTKELLFLRITNDEAHLIGIFNHGEWENIDIIEILHSEWPESIKHFKMNRIQSIRNKPTSTDIKLLRRNNLNSLIELQDGTVYAGPGAGLSTAGTPIMVTMIVDNLLTSFDKDFEIIKKEIENSIPEDYTEKNITIGLKIDEGLGKLFYIIKESGQLIPTQY